LPGSSHWSVWRGGTGAVFMSVMVFPSSLLRQI
jgi:hypothetical protein